MSNQSAVDEQRVLGQIPVKNQEPGLQGQPDMRVRVYSPFREYYNDMAVSLTAENATGPFDILPHHHSFISLLLPCELIIRSVSRAEQKVIISGGILHVKADEVIVFLDI